VIRDQMEGTRASLADKLETLEAQVRETVQTATETVQSTTETVTSAVENVKETVASTVENVKSTVESVSDSVASVADTLDPRPYVENHPWAAFGTAVGVGFLGGLLAGGSSGTTTALALRGSRPRRLLPRRRPRTPRRLSRPRGG